MIKAKTFGLIIKNASGIVLLVLVYILLNIIYMNGQIDGFEKSKSAYYNGYNQGYIQGIKDYPHHLSNHVDTLQTKCE